jgi:TolB-like protein
VQPTPDEIRRQLDRILASEGFANAERMSGFLTYIVNRTLAGEGDQVKEYAIGVDVFGRNGDYDPRLDSIVRVEARRLRSKVEEYYAGPGIHDPVIIRLRRGSYVPAFEPRPAAAVETAAESPSTPPAPARSVRGSSGWRLGFGLVAIALVLVSVAARRSGLWTGVGKPTPEISVAVLPFAQYSADERDRLLAARLTDGVTSELARLGTIAVVSHTSALQFAGVRKPAAEIARVLNANMIMEGSVTRSGDRVSVSIRLVNADRDRKVWVEDFEGRESDARDLQRRIAERAAPFVLHSGKR